MGLKRWAWRGVVAACPALLVAAAAVLVMLCLPLNDAVDRALDWLQDGRSFNVRNRYLLGNYAPVSAELSAVPLVVRHGAVPDTLRGVFLRTGPNPIVGHGFTKRAHWFDGHGMVHAVRLHGSERTAAYSNAWLRTPRYLLERQLGRDFFGGIGELSGVVGLLKVLLISPKPRLAGLTPLTVGQANTAVSSWGGRVFALHEGSLPFELALSAEGGAVESLGFVDFGGRLGYPVSAHPKVDGESGEVLLHGYSFSPDLPPLMYGALRSEAATGGAAGGSGARPVELPSATFEFVPELEGGGSAAFAHDMAITRTRLVLLVPSIRFTPEGIVAGSVFSHSDEHRALFGLVPRSALGGGNATTGAAVAWVRAREALSFVHVLNAWDGAEDVPEQAGRVFLWLPVARDFDGTLDAMPDDDPAESQPGMPAPGSPPSEAERDPDSEQKRRMKNFWEMSEVEMDVAAGTATVRRVQPEASAADGLLNVEFPRVHPAYAGHYARWGFSAIMSGRDALFTGVAKWEIVPGGGRLVSATTYGGGEAGGEPVLCPKRPEAGRAADSDAVWVLSWVHDMRANASALVVLDGEVRDGALPEVARLAADGVRVPFGFHGHWIPEAELLEHVARRANANRTPPR